MFELKPEHRPIRPPDLDIDGLPAADRKRGQSIYDNLKALASNSLRYSEALLAVQLCGALIISRRDDEEALKATAVTGWFHIAVNAAALCARNYWKALQALDGLPGSVPLWRQRMDFAAFKIAKQEFRTRFPEIDKVRHAIAHSEYYANPDMAMVPEGSEIPTDPYSGVRVFFDGNLVGCEVSEDAAVFIVQNVAKVFAAFDGLQRPAREESAPQR